MLEINTIKKMKIQLNILSRGNFRINMDLVKDPYIVNIVNPVGFDLNITKNILNDSCES